MQYTLSLNPAPAALMNAVPHAFRRGQWMSPTPSAANHDSGFDDATYTAQSPFSLSKNNAFQTTTPFRPGLCGLAGQADATGPIASAVPELAPVALAVMVPPLESSPVSSMINIGNNAAAALIWPRPLKF